MNLFSFWSRIKIKTSTTGWEERNYLKYFCVACCWLMSPRFCFHFAQIIFLVRKTCCYLTIERTKQISRRKLRRPVFLTHSVISVKNQVKSQAHTALKSTLKPPSPQCAQKPRGEDRGRLGSIARILETSPGPSAV